MQRGHRGSTTPMDFEWSNSNGPTDPSSPFMNIQKQQSAKKREYSGALKHESGWGSDASKLTSGPSFGQTGTHSVLDSPSKNGFATPNRLREPDNRPFYFSQESNKPLPLPPHVQNTWEPRTPTGTYDFSSGGETPNTPGVDSDAATPDTQLADRMGRLANGDPKKPARRESWFKRAFGGSPSPLKDRDRDDSRKYYSQKADHRIQKRRSERSHSKKRSLRDIDDDYESEQDRPNSGGMLQQRPNSAMLPPQPQAPVPHTYATSIAGFMHWLEAHPDLPSVLSYYLHLGVNFVLAGVFIYIIWCAWSAVMADVDIESSKHMSEVMVDIAACAKHYRDNLCDHGAPMMAKLCGTWETCMSRDPRKVARASVTAKTFAMIFNSFVEEFSYKSMAFTAFIIFGGFNLSNWAFGLFRHNQQSQQVQHQHHQQPNEYIPQTPHRVPSNNYMDQNHQSYQQNWQQHTPYQTPYAGQRQVEAPPLVHTQSMPVLPMAGERDMLAIEDRKTPSRKRGVFR